MDQEKELEILETLNLKKYNDIIVKQNKRRIMAVEFIKHEELKEKLNADGPTVVNVFAE